MPQPRESCQSPASMKCSGCSRAWYCNKTCHSANWYLHKFKCDTRDKLTSADYLGPCLCAKPVPLDKQTQKDFGFQRRVLIPKPGGTTCMYQDLIYHRGVPVKTLHCWRMRSVLIGEIKKILSVELRALLPGFSRISGCSMGRRRRNGARHTQTRTFRRRCAARVDVLRGVFGARLTSKYAPLCLNGPYRRRLFLSRWPHIHLRAVPWTGRRPVDTFRILLI